MTHNATISIAAKWLDDMNNATLTPRQQRDGQEELHRADRHRRLPQQARRQQDDLPRRGEDRRDLQGRQEQGLAKKFLSLPAGRRQPDAYVEGSLGRWFPVTKAGQQSPFWKNDPHRLAVYNQFMAGTTPFEFTKNYKFTVLNNENVWAKAMNRVLSEKWPVDRRSTR
jgi:multiple sugar transport system substrate-binding protein